MRIISHRGNLEGPGKLENQPDQIDLCIKSGYDSEIDLWVLQKNFFLGHDFGINEISLQWLLDRQSFLWIHCKNSEALEFLTTINGLQLKFFWHQNDNYALTSNKKIWVFPGQEIPIGGIAVLPEMWTKQPSLSQLSSCFAICTDYPIKYSALFTELKF